MNYQKDNDSQEEDWIDDILDVEETPEERLKTDLKTECTKIAKEYLTDKVKMPWIDFKTWQFNKEWEQQKQIELVRYLRQQN